MTDDDAKKRIDAIEKLQNDLDRRIASVDLNLYAQLAASAETILADPKTLNKLLTKFNRTDYLPALQQFGVDILLINDLNATYFEGAVGEELGGELVSQELFNAVKADVEALTAEQFGIAASGEVVPGGLFDLFSQDTTVQRQIQQFAYGQKSSGIGLERFKKNLKNFIVGNPDNPDAPNRGVYTRHYETVAFDAYQQADRLAQQSYAAGLQMTAFLYLGGTVPGTRPWCRLRDGKCFLRSEIEKFGTSADTYGGYENKAIGYFSGKPKGDYSPFINAGGWKCRHHYSAISDREAMRRRTDLRKGENGQLQIDPVKKMQSDEDEGRYSGSYQPPVRRAPNYTEHTDGTPASKSKVTADAERWAYRHGVAEDIDYSSMPPAVADRINNQLYKLKLAHGKTYQSIGLTSMLGENEPFASGFTTDASGGRLIINQRLFKSSSAVTTTLKRLARQEYSGFLYDGTLEAAITHEYGHLLSLSTFIGSSSNPDLVRQAWDRSLAGKPTADEASKLVSRYARVDKHETTAEAFVFYTQTGGVSGLSDLEKSLLKRIVKL